MLSRFACTARQRIRLEGGGYRRDHLRCRASTILTGGDNQVGRFGGHHG
jgi:hypothetical protein